MPHPVKAVANAIINKASASGEKVSHLKLQKLLYYMCGYHVAAFDQPLMDHTFEAWDYGPVVPALYAEFKHFRNQPITTLASEYDWGTEDFTIVPIPVGDARLDKVLDFVWKTYGKYSGPQLSDLTHASGSPWDITRKENPGMKDADITREKLKTHFSQHIKSKKAA